LERALRLEQLVVGLFDRARDLLFLLSQLLLAELLVDVEQAKVEVRAPELREWLVGLNNAQRGKFRIGGYCRGARGDGSCTYTPKGALLKFDCNWCEKPRAGHIDTEVWIALRPGREDLIVRDQYVLIEDFDLAIVGLRGSDGLLQGQNFRF